MKIKFAKKKIELKKDEIEEKKINDQLKNKEKKVLVVVRYILGNKLKRWGKSDQLISSSDLNLILII